MAKNDWGAGIKWIERRFHLWDEDLAFILDVPTEVLVDWRNGVEEPPKDKIKELREIAKDKKVTKENETLSLSQARFTKRQRLFLKEILARKLETAEKESEKELIIEIWQRL